MQLIALFLVPGAEVAAAAGFDRHDPRRPADRAEPVPVERHQRAVQAVLVEDLRDSFPGQPANVPAYSSSSSAPTSDFSSSGASGRGLRSLQIFAPSNSAAAVRLNA